MTASLRATATFAFLIPARLAIRMPQALSADHFCSGVAPLISRWGGEVASFWMKDQSILAVLADIGKSRVIEIVVPVMHTNQSYWAAEAVVATFGRSLGCATSKHDFDLYVTAPLRSGAILAVHTEGDASFRRLGRSCPEGYVDVNIGYWKELTGEDD